MVRSDTALRNYEDMVAFYADRLEPCGYDAVRAWIETHPDGAVSARRDAAIEYRVMQHYQRVVDEPIPPRLLTQGQAPVIPWVTRTAAAAVLVAAGGAGGWWFSMPGGQAGSRHAASVEQASAASGPAQGAMGSQQIRVNGAAPAPDLSARGYHVISRQRVTGTPQALTEFVYADNDGAQLRIFARKRAPETSFEPKISFNDGVPRARWRANGQEYALVGDLPPRTLRELARNATPRSDAPDAGRSAERQGPQQADARTPADQAPLRSDVLPAADVQRQM